MTIKHKCHCCDDDTNHIDDMDTTDFWYHSEAMREKFGGLCCRACVDAYCVTEDGELMPRAKAIMDIDGNYWADRDEMDEFQREAENAAREEYADQMMLRAAMR